MGSDYRVERPADVDAFLSRASDFLIAHEAENNLILGISSSLRQTPLLYGEPARFAVVTRDDRVVGAALQTPPFNLVVAFDSELGAVDALVDAFVDLPLPGVHGAVDLSTRFAERWHALTGQAVEPGLAERAFKLTRVKWPRPTSGRMRAAERRDRQLIIDWLVAFADEARVGPFLDPDVATDRWLARQGRTLYIWEDRDRVVSLAGAGGETPNGVRVGPVYTPPRYRSRGYASNLVAHCSAAELDRGRRFVFLFTDVTNPTSNKIYESIGYQPVVDIQLFQFVPRTPSGPAPRTGSGGGRPDR